MNSYKFSYETNKTISSSHTPIEVSTSTISTVPRHFLNRVKRLLSHSSTPHLLKPLNHPIASVQIPRVYLKLTVAKKSLIGMHYRTSACVNSLHPQSNNGQRRSVRNERKKRRTACTVRKFYACRQKAKSAPLCASQKRKDE